MAYSLFAIHSKASIPGSFLPAKLQHGSPAGGDVVDVLELVTGTHGVNRLPAADHGVALRVATPPITRARAIVPVSNGRTSKWPSGPFQIIVLAVFR